MKKILAEFTGTALLVFVGTGAIIVNEVNGGMLGPGGISFAFGAIVTMMIICFGPVSGAHINPAVSIAFWLSGHLPAHLLPRYILAQLSGAVFASLILLTLFPGLNNYGMTLPSDGLWQSLSMEITLSFILMTVILSVVRGGPRLILIALAVGATVGLAAFIGGPVSGASMNPARSFGPAMVSANIAFLWLYFLAPLVGTTVAVHSCRLMHRDGCCSPASCA